VRAPARAARGYLTDLKSTAHFRTVSESERLAVAWFTADWCGPCKTMQPAVRKPSEELSSAVDFYRVDVDEHAKVVDLAQVASVPQFHLFKGGKLVSLVNGANPDALESAVKEHADSPAPAEA
jgi:thioredoxin-like negative regulator of GroEL